MDELQQLYQETILDHNKNPRNFKKLDNANYLAEGYNPLCGDRFTVYLLIENNVIKELSFTGSGCAISKASASIMTTMLKGKTLEDAQENFEKFHLLVTEGNKDVDLEEFGKIAVFAGVRDFPVRVKCASLPWHTMKSAISNEEKVVSTE
jgi:nitrogen fixation NifU-like protein